MKYVTKMAGACLLLAVPALCAATGSHFVMSMNYTVKQPDSPWKQSGHGLQISSQIVARGEAGCALVAFTITGNGRTRDVEVKQASSELVRWESGQMVDDWRFNSNTESASDETREVRIDFCPGGQSQDGARQRCEAQARRACG